MKKEGHKLRTEFLKTMIQLSTAGFGLAAALAWNETIQALINRFVPKTGSDIWSKSIYAIVVTGIAVLVTYILGKMIQAEEDKEEKAQK